MRKLVTFLLYSAIVICSNCEFSESKEFETSYDLNQVQNLLKSKDESELVKASQEMANDEITLKIPDDSELIKAYINIADKNTNTEIKGELINKASEKLMNYNGDVLDEQKNINLIKEVFTKYGELNLENSSYKNLKILRENFIDNYLNHLIETKNLTAETKLEMVVSGMKFLQTRVSIPFLASIAQKSETILFSNVSNQNLSDDRLRLISSLLDARYQRSTEDVVSYLKGQLDKTTNEGVKYNVGLSLAVYYSKKGNYDLSEEFFDVAINAKPQFPNINQRMFAFVPKVLKLITIRDSGNISQLISEYKNINDDINWVLDDVFSEGNTSNSEITNRNNYLLSIASALMEIQNFLGEYQSSIKFGNKLLIRLNSDGKNLILKLYEGLIYKQLAVSYKGIHDLENAKKFRELSIQSLTQASFIDVKELTFEIREELKRNDFSDAKININLLKALLARNPSTIGTSFLSSINRLLFDLENNVEYEVANKNFCNQGAILAEQYFYQNVNTSIKDKLDFLKLLYTYNKCAGDNVYASYFAKQYINLLQDIRQDLSSDKEILGSFTQSQADILKDFANNFYDIGDTNSTLLTFQILKENEFLDYLRTRSSDELANYKLSIPQDIEEVNSKMLNASKELAALEKTLESVNKNNDDINFKLLMQGIELKKKQIKEYSLQLQNKIHSQISKKIDIKNVNLKFKLSNNEALIDYVLLKDSLTIYLTTNKGTTSFKKEIDRDQFSVFLYKISVNLANNQELSPTDLRTLSETLFTSEILNLKTQQITTLKIRGDELIGMIPMVILSSNNQKLGNTFNVVMQGLGSHKYIKNQISSIHAFGTTKKFRGFDQLPNVKDETSYIVSLGSKESSKTSASLSLDDDFNRENFYNSFTSGANIIHVSTHFKPLSAKNSSGELLLGDGSLLSVEDIRDNLKNMSSINLVTLSACDTGLILSKNGTSNLEGLSNLFNVKGASFVIGTLWPVSDDSTADFMRLFYILTLKDNISPLESLQLTQLAFQSGSLSMLPPKAILPNDDFIKGLSNRIANYRSPFFWAPFQITGS